MLYIGEYKVRVRDRLRSGEGLGVELGIWSGVGNFG